MQVPAGIVLGKPIGAVLFPMFNIAGKHWSGQTMKKGGLIVAVSRTTKEMKKQC